MDDRFFLAELERRIANLIQIGKICEVYPDEGLCRVDFGGRKSGKIPYFVPRAGDDKFYFHPDEGEQALVFCPFGDERWGFALIGIFSIQKTLPEGAKQGKFILQFKDGARFEYDRSQSTLKITFPNGTEIFHSPSKFEIKSACPVTVSAPQAEVSVDGALKVSASSQDEKVSIHTVNGDLSVNGNLILTGNIHCTGGITSGGSVCASGGLQTSPGGQTLLVDVFINTFNSHIHTAPNGNTSTPTPAYGG